MLIALVPSGVEWLDTEIGGFPTSGVVAAAGGPGTGKTSLAIAFARAQLRRQGRVCFLTSETPDAVIETARGLFELDLTPYIAQRALTILSYAPFFANKVRSLSSADAPLAELKGFLDDRGMSHVVFDTVDPMLTWVEATSAKASVRRMLGQMQEWGRSVLCTTGATTAAATELARSTSGSLELEPGRLRVRQAGWGNVYNLEGALQFVQGRGLVARTDASGGTAIASSRAGAPAGARSLVGQPASGGVAPWASLIGSVSAGDVPSDRGAVPSSEPVTPRIPPRSPPAALDEAPTPISASPFADTAVTEPAYAPPTMPEPPALGRPRR